MEKSFPSSKKPENKPNKIRPAALKGVRNMVLLTGQGPLFAYIQRLVGRGPQAEDLYMEVQLRFRRSCSEPDPVVALPWLYRVARNLAFDWKRRAKRRPTASLDAETGGDTGLTLLDRIAGADARPETLLETTELRERLHAAIAALPPRQRAVAVRRLFHSRSFREIAEELSIPLGTALGRFHAAAKSLRGKLEDYHA